MERLDNSKLTQIQKRIVKAISNEKKVAIVGGPGTGKTVLAMSAMDNSKDSKQILLTYSKPLSNMIYDCMGGKCKTSTVHRFGWNLGHQIECKLKQFSAEYSYPKDDKFCEVINREYGYDSEKNIWPKWNNLIRDYSKLDSNQQKEIKYSTIFVDEGQDLPDDVYSFLEKITDKIVVTFDDSQEVGIESSTKGEVIRETGLDCNRILSMLNLEENFYDLIDNFRNTVSIERVAKLFYNNYGTNGTSLGIRDERYNKRKKGELPIVLFMKADQDMLNDIADDAYQNNKQVGLIVDDKDSFDWIYNLMQNAVIHGYIQNDRFFYKCGDKDNMKGNGNHLNGTGVFLTTFKSAKGMEFDKVYIFDCQKIKLNTAAEKNKFYVAATRAKDTLTLVFDLQYDDNCPVLDIIKNNESLFNISR